MFIKEPIFEIHLLLIMDRQTPLSLHPPSFSFSLFPHFYLHIHKNNECQKKNYVFLGVWVGFLWSMTDHIKYAFFFSYCFIKKLHQGDTETPSLNIQRLKKDKRGYLHVCVSYETGFIFHSYRNAISLRMYGLIIQALTCSCIYLLFCTVAVLNTTSFPNLLDCLVQILHELACWECLDTTNTELRCGWIN